jgi:small subunit ribosomal protein S5
MNNQGKENKKPATAGRAAARPQTGNAGAGRSVYADKRRRDRGGRPGGRGERQDEFEQRIVDIARVTRVMAGGKRMRFRACVVVGNKKGKIGSGLSKGADVTMAVTKAVNKAKKNIVDVPLVNETIPHAIYFKYGAAKILLKPASKGKGVIAGGAARIVLEMAGIKNITSKILGTNNKVNITKCTIEALKNLKNVETKKAEKAAGDKNRKPADSGENAPIKKENNKN